MPGSITFDAAGTHLARQPIAATAPFETVVYAVQLTTIGEFQCFGLFDG
jgi:hypothetical protein